MIVLDTDHLTIFAQGRSAEAQRLFDRLTDWGEPFGTTVISVEEQLRGWLALINRRKTAHAQIPAYAGLKDIIQLLEDWPILDWDERSADLFEMFRDRRIRIGTMDLKIASIAIANDALLLSRNLVDFREIPELYVENWLD